LLYAALTIARAPSVWGIGRRPDGTNPLAQFEPRISANLRNQFEWPIFFYVVCILAVVGQSASSPSFLWLAWLFIAGRVVHSGVQILTTNVRLRGLVFMINFVAVLWMWALLVVWRSVQTLDSTMYVARWALVGAALLAAFQAWLWGQQQSWFSLAGAIALARALVALVHLPVTRYAEALGRVWALPRRAGEAADVSQWLVHAWR
jgi:hypothetical protein